MAPESRYIENNSIHWSENSRSRVSSHGSGRREMRYTLRYQRFILSPSSDIERYWLFQSVDIVGATSVIYYNERDSLLLIRASRV